MQTTTIGTTDLTVSAIGLGAMHLSLAGRPPEDEAIRVIHRALDRGITFIDTADSYCKDESDKHHNERLIHKALQQYDRNTDAVVVATKGGMMRPDGQWTRNSRPDHLRRTIRASHEALGGNEAITLWQHHAPDRDVPPKQALQPIKEAVDEGLIRYVGVSNYTVEQIEEAREVVDVVSVQNQYSPWQRAPEENGVLAYCEQEGLTFLPYSPLGGSSRAKRLEEYEALAEIAEAKGISPQRLVLAWLMAQSDTILPIPGASRVESIEDSVGAVEVTLSEDEVRRIDAETAQPVHS